MPLFAAKKSEKGQILLVVVLASVISLTVGLAAISRSITNTRVSTEESNSQKALSAAEAGVEEQINKANKQVLSGTGDITLSNKSIFNAKSDPVGGKSFAVNNGTSVPRDEGADVWLSTYPGFASPYANTTLTLYWITKYGASDPNCVNDPAIEVAVVSGPDKQNPSMARYAYDSCLTRQGQNGFTKPNGSVPAALSALGYNNAQTLPAITNGFIARVIPLYADSKIYVESTVGLPAQGYTISSTGTSGQTVREVKVFQGFPRLPVEFFPYNLFLP